jgi:hypothetical protein
MTLYLADSTDISKLQVYSKVNLATRQELGQVFTPLSKTLLIVVFSDLNLKLEDSIGKIG